MDSKITTFFKKRINSDQAEESKKKPKSSLLPIDPNTNMNVIIKDLDFQGLNLERKTIAADWLAAFANDIESPWFTCLKERLMSEFHGIFKYNNLAGKIIYPPIGDIYSFTTLPLDQIKVVIVTSIAKEKIGQDPYHQPHQAHGLCFSVKKGVAIPPSLKNIYKELSTDIDGFVAPEHGFLKGWHEQGVLLLVILS